MNAVAPVDPAAKNKGGRPQVPPTEKMIEKVLGSEKGQAAISSIVTDAVAKAMAELTTQFQRVRGDAPLTSNDQSAITEIANAMGTVVNQTTGRKIVAPEELARREHSRKRMMEILTRIRVQGLLPRYNLISETYLNDALIRPYENGENGKIQQVEITWDGVPNEAMVPVREDDNHIAHELYDAFMGAIGGATGLTGGTDWSKPPSNEPYAVSPKGNLVIRGARGMGKRIVGSLGEGEKTYAGPENRGPSFESRVGRVGHPTDRNAEFVHVLGTNAPPARQNGPGAEASR